MFGSCNLTGAYYFIGLQEVILWSIQVTRQGAEALQAALPECDVSTAMLE